ncbi:RasGEF domain containing protein [Histomonas meleagridis]|uniref:RasGEF domain containing protein n=1 Tax=Histomonas meleagridis TaxID=135588 RepID=UPI00355938AF|nr:RasGEF domain containing protein [Histomonas meleagridis]KAH0800954.1 RasGEF domain containing protein [Histomonas meleagridis]
MSAPNSSGSTIPKIETSASLPNNSEPLIGSLDSRGNSLKSQSILIGTSQGSDDSRKSDIKDPEQLSEEQSKWLNEILSENPQYLSLRERALGYFGGYSFANVTHAQTVTALSTVNRHVILELIYQHLQAIGMYRTAEILASESGHVFQTSKQPWNRTDLHLLASLAVGHRDDPWNVPAEMFHSVVNEYREEDFFSSSYREDPNTIWDEFNDKDLNAVYDNPDVHSYRHLIQASLKRLVVYLCTSDLQSINDEEQQLFFLTIHSITSANHFLQHLVTLFDCDLDGTPYKPVPEKIMTEIRRNIINLIRKWVNYHGLFIGQRTLKSVAQFINRILADSKYDKLKPYAETILKSMKGITYGTKKGSLEKIDKPIIPEPQKLFMSSLTILDPSPIEVARQITLIYHKKYSSIHSLEFIIALKSRRATIQTPTFKDFFLFDEQLTQLVASTFLESEENNRFDAYQKIFEIIQALNQLYNFEAVSCLSQLMLRPDIISKVFIKNNDPTLEQKIEQIKSDLLDIWKKAGNNDKNETVKPTDYENSINTRFGKWEACIPNMHVEIKRIDKKILEMDDYVNGLINWEKICAIAKRCTTLYRFQNTTYTFWTVPQIKNVILKGANLTLQQIEEKLSGMQE